MQARCVYGDIFKLCFELNRIGIQLRGGIISRKQKAAPVGAGELSTRSRDHGHGAGKNQRIRIVSNPNCGHDSLLLNN